MRTPLLLSIVLAWCCLAAGVEARTWTSVDGKTMEAEFVESDGSRVTLKRSDGQTFTLALGKISEADRRFVREKLQDTPVDSKKSKASEVTGEIREPEDGAKVPREFAVKGRTRGVPDDFVAMLFRRNLKSEEFFPHNEYSKANRSFTTYIYHGETDPTEWEIHLYVLPEPDAKGLAAWHTKAAAMVKAGQADKVEPYDAKLTDEAIHVVTVKYYLETN